MTVVFFGKAFEFSCFVFVHPSFQVVCQAGVHHIFVFVGHDVNKEVVLA